MNLNRKNLYIGIFCLSALIIVILAILFLHPSYGDNRKILHVRFTNIDKISVGTRVTMAGKPVGKVIAIDEIIDARTETPGPYGRAFYYDLTLRVDSSVQIYKQDQILTNTSGFMGERTIAIIPNIITNKNIDIEVSDQVLYASSAASLDRALEEMLSVTQKIGEAVDVVLKIVGSNTLDIEMTLQSLSHAAQKIDHMLTGLEEKGIVNNIDSSVQNFSKTLSEFEQGLLVLKEEQFWNHLALLSKNLNETAQSLNQPESLTALVKNSSDLSVQLNTSWPKIVHAIEQIDSLSQNLQEVAQNLNSDHSSLGRLIKDDDLYLKAYAAMSKINTLLNDINHYGLLFNKDSNWQKLRTVRVNKLSRLQSPQAFRQYFEQELDEIQTSLARVQELFDIEKNHKAPQGTDQFHNDFKGELRSLIDSIEALQGDLNAFNENFSDQP